MKTIYSCLLAALCLLLVGPSDAFANPNWNFGSNRHWNRGGDRHQHHHPKRPRNYHPNRHGYGNSNSGSKLLAYGARSGKLTESELRALRKEQRELQEKRRHYLRDGHLSSSERRDLREEYREFDEELREEIADGEYYRRPGTPRRWHKK